MRKLLDQLARGHAARLREDVLDRNALLVLDQRIRETRAGLERSRRALAVAMAGDRAEARRLEDVKARATLLEERAVAALRAGREDLAAEAAAAIVELHAESDAMRAARARFEDEVARIRAVVADATRRQAALERGRRVAAAHEAVRRLGTDHPRHDEATLREAEATLVRLRDLQSVAADTAAALAAIEPDRDIAERLEREGFGPRTGPHGDAVLDRLRRRAADQPASA